MVFARRGRLRSLSHLETQQTVVRALRRACVPLAFSGGYRRRPKVALLTALPVGAEAESLVALARLRESPSAASLQSRLKRALPEGLALRALRICPADQRRRLVKVLWETWGVAVRFGRPAPRDALERLFAPSAYARLACVRDEKRIPLGASLRLLRLAWLSASGTEAVMEFSVLRTPGPSPTAAGVVEAVFGEYQPEAIHVTLLGLTRGGVKS